LQSKKKIKSVGIFLKEDDDEEEDEKENEPEPNPELFGRGRRTTVLESKLRVSSFSVDLLVLK